MIAIQEQCIDDVADLACARFDQAEPQVFRRILDTVVVLRDSAFGSQDQNGRGVRELPGFRIVLVIEAGGPGQGVDRILMAYEEVPALFRAGTLVTAEELGFLFGGNLGRVMGVEADGDDVEFLAHFELHHAQRILESAENLSTKHGAGEVDQVEDDGLLAEVVAEADGAAEIVGEGQIRGNGLIEILPHADIFQSGRADVGGRRHDAVRHTLSEGGCGQDQN